MNQAERPSSHTSRPAVGGIRELFFVSLPLIISAGSHSLMNIADRVMLAGFAPTDKAAGGALDVIAAVTPSAMLHWTVVCIPLGTILYANTFISQYDGAGKKRELTACMWQVVWLAITAGLLLMLAAPFSDRLFSFAGHSPGVVVQEARYFSTLCLGSPLLLVSNALGCFFSGRRKTTVVMIVNILSVLVNIVLDYGLIFGHWGLPQLGIVGAAIATVLARGCDIVMYVVLIRRENCRGEYPFRSTWKPDKHLLTKYLRFGVPSGLHYFVDNSGFLVFLLIVGNLNRDAMAATNLAFSVNSLIFVPLLGFGTAVQTLVGHHIGAGLKPAATRTTWNAVAMATTWTGAAAVLLVYFPETSLKPFLFFDNSTATDTQSIKSVLPVAIELLKFVAIYSVFDAVAVVLASALRGAGDTVFPMVMTMFSSWLVMTLPAWIIVQSKSATINQLWMTCTAHIFLMGTAMLLRFLSGKWKNIQLT